MGDHNGKVGIEQKIYILPQNMGKKELCVPRKLGTQSLFFPVLWQEIYLPVIVLMKLIDWNNARFG